MFATRIGKLPPSATADFVAIDEGNCSPRFVRPTLHVVPNDAVLCERTKMSFGAVLQPLADPGAGESPLPVVSYPDGPIRCNRCRAYINPWFKFKNLGATMVCNMCDSSQPVPEGYQCNLDGDGLRRDRMDRPELHKGSVEFVMPAITAGAGVRAGLAAQSSAVNGTKNGTSAANAVKPLCYVFVLDVSPNAIASGLVQASVQAVRSALRHLASNPRARVGVISYDATVHFHCTAAPRKEPEVLVMCDAADPFLPIPPEQILVNVSDPEQLDQLDAAVATIATVYVPSALDKTKLNAFGAAAKVAVDLLEPTGGKALLFQSSITQTGVGKLTLRDDRSLYLTPRETELYVPQDTFYQTLASHAASKSVNIDLFACAPGYMDLATTSFLTTTTGGQLYKYRSFSAVQDGDALQRDLTRNVARTTGYDATMIVRVSAGLKVAEYYGNFYHKVSNEVSLAAVDCDKAFGVRVEHLEKLAMNPAKEACLQLALLYTTASGERRVRVHSYAMVITDDVGNLYRMADLDAIMNLSLKQVVRQLFTSGSCLDVQDSLANACVDNLCSYRRYSPNSTSSSVLLADTLRLLPLCSLGLAKSPLIAEGLPVDDRMFFFAYASAMPASVSVPFVTPRFVPLLGLSPELGVPLGATHRVFMPAQLSLSAYSLESTGIFILDDTTHIYIWVGPDIDPTIHHELFMEASAPQEAKAPTQQTQHQQIGRRVWVLRPAEEEDDPQSLRSKLHAMINYMRRGRMFQQAVRVIGSRLPVAELQQARFPLNHRAMIERSPDEVVFFRHLIEDDCLPQYSSLKRVPVMGGAKPPNMMSYSDFIVWAHKRISLRLGMT